MPVQTLGIFDKVFEWVYDKLLSPVIEWLSKILATVFEWIFENILMGFLKTVFEWFWEYIGVEIANFFFAQIYGWYCALLELVDVMQYGFDVLIGLQDITYIDGAGQEQSSTLLNYIIFNDTIRTALVGITFIALALTILFSIYSVMRSSLDFDFENKRPVGRVMSATLKAMMTFLFIPLIVWVGLNLASIVLKQTAAALSGSTAGTASISDTILLVSAMDADKNNAEFSFEAQPWSGIVDGSLNYLTFAGRINIAEIDYLVGFASAIFCLIIMVICLFSFIRRIYDIVLLYIVSPYFASTIVLDDGQKFAHWRETFIAKVLVGFGSALGMRLFLLLVPIIMGDDIQFFDNSLVEATAGYVLKLIFILGGMYAVYKSSSLLTSIISTSVAQEEQMNNAMVMHKMMAGGKKLGGLAIGGMKKLSDGRGGAGTGAAPKTGNKQPIPESPSLPSDAMKINGMTGATKAQSEAWKKTFGGLEIKEDYEHKPDMHISDVEDMSEAFDNLFKLEDSTDSVMKHTSDVEDMSEAFDNLFGTPNTADVADISEEMGNLFGTPNTADVADVSEELSGLFNPENHSELDIPFNAETADMSAAFDNLYGNDTPNTLDVEDMSQPLNRLFDETAQPLRYGFAGLSVGGQNFRLPRGYTAMPKLVPTAKAASRIEQMKQNGGQQFSGYYDAVSEGISSGNYSVPDLVRSSSKFGGITEVGSSKMNVPEGYTVVPEIMKTSEALVAANNITGGKNQKFYQEFAAAITPPNYSTVSADAAKIRSASQPAQTAQSAQVQQAVRPRSNANAQQLPRPIPEQPAAQMSAAPAQTVSSTVPAASQPMAIKREASPKPPRPMTSTDIAELEKLFSKND